MPRDRRMFSFLVFLAGLWWLLSDGATASWVVGLPAIAAASWAARRLSMNPSHVVSVRGILSFSPFFLWESLRGGVDVALRTLTPQMRIEPGFTEVYTELQRQDARVFMVNCINLLPGTLAADLDDHRLHIHLLDMAMDVEPELRRLERAIARIFPGSLES